MVADPGSFVDGFLEGADLAYRLRKLLAKVFGTSPSPRAAAAAAAAAAEDPRAPSPNTHARMHTHTHTHAHTPFPASPILHDRNALSSQPCPPLLPLKDPALKRQALELARQTLLLVRPRAPPPCTAAGWARRGLCSGSHTLSPARLSPALICRLLIGQAAAGSEAAAAAATAANAARFCG